MENYREIIRLKSSGYSNASASSSYGSSRDTASEVWMLANEYNLNQWLLYKI